MFFFFFQAEDGIRDVAVTGVQTCALPICAPTDHVLGVREIRLSAGAEFVVAVCGEIMRSEEHTSELQSRLHLVCRLLLEKKKIYSSTSTISSISTTNG